MKTVMQELIDEIVEHLTYDDDLSEDSRITYETIRLRCLGKLKLEKEQLCKMYVQGRKDYHLDYYPEKHANETYNETYEQD